MDYNQDTILLTGYEARRFPAAGLRPRGKPAFYFWEEGHMLKVMKQYLRATDLVYLGMCMFCSMLSILVLISIGRYLLGGFDTDEIEGIITGLGGYRYAVVQAGAMVMGLVCAIFLSCIDYRALVRIWPVHTLLTLGMVLPTLVLHNVSIGPLTIGFSPEGTDNFSWYRLGGITFQPAELLKISFILTFAMHLEQSREHINEPRVLMRLLAHILVPVGLIHIQGDDGSAMVFAAIGCIMLFVAGLSWKYILSALAALAAVGGVVLVFFSDKILKSYQVLRILAVLDPDNPAYKDYTLQQTQGKISIGAGEIFGRGLFGEEHHYVANAFNDFIFSYMAEAIGFVGCCVVLGVLFAVVCRTLLTGLRSQDRLGTYICAGVFAAMAWQVVINLGMNLSLLPVIGVTLPFFSGGGTSMLMLYLCVGIVLSVYIHNKKNLFE